MIRERKSFFEKTSVGSIKDYNNIRETSEDLVNNVIILNEHDALILYADLIPLGFESKRKYKKHGLVVEIETPSLEDIITKKLTPVKLRKQAFKQLEPVPYTGYLVVPPEGPDQIPRKFPLIENMEGVKLYDYACLKHQDSELPFRISKYFEDSNFKSVIEIKPYDNVSGVNIDGAEVLVKVPSRDKNTLRYKSKLVSVPVKNNDNKWGIAYNINSTHECEHKRHDIRYPHETVNKNRKIITFDAHDVAAMLAVADYYATQERDPLINKGNYIPLEQSLVAIPTQETVDFYEKLNHNIFIQTSKDKASRQLTQAEKEVMIWGLVYISNKEKKPDPFFAKNKIWGYNWRTNS
ncbi:hypothetical protein GOV08_04810 [Candidatus Woesearchaeota archaeon]|nr:hypothetical protein [Candidatus Woesearchaeota archaeon]